MNPYIPQLLPFYANNQAQSFRQQYCSKEPNFQHIVLISGNQVRLPSFQINRIQRSAAPLEFYIRKVIGGATVYEINPALIQVKPLDSPLTKQALVWSEQWASPISGLPLESNTYYFIEVSDGVETWYSEAFYAIAVTNNSQFFPPDCHRVIRLEWSTACIIDEQIAQGASFAMFLDADPGKPEWLYEEEGEKDALGLFKPNFQRLEKEYELEIIAPEYVADALATTALFGVVEIYFRDGQVWVLNTPRVDVEWFAGGCTAKIKYKFRRDPIVKMGCC